MHHANAGIAPQIINNGNITGAITSSGISGIRQLNYSGTGTLTNGNGISGADTYTWSGTSWISNTRAYTVMFNTLTGTAINSVTVSHGAIVTLPTAPTLADHTFEGWYKEATYTNEWNFVTDTVTANTTLYAKWTESIGFGAGTEGDPFRIGTADQLADLAGLVNGTSASAFGYTTGTGIHYKLTDDINLSAYSAGEGWIPIGTSIKPFYGIFDGDNKTISNLIIDVTDKSNMGLFGSAKGIGTEIKNLKISGNVTVTTSAAIQYDIALLVGGMAEGKITNCHVLSGNVTSATNVAGVAGSISNGTIIDGSSNAATITATNPYTIGYSGGIVAYSDNTTGTTIIRNSYNTGTITGRYAAGILAELSGENAGAEIVNCYNSAQITGMFAAGGIIASIGFWDNTNFNFLVKNVYNTGNIFTPYSGLHGYTGGIIGLISNGSGIVTLENFYNTGDITSENTSFTYQNGTGGIIGYILLEGTTFSKYVSFGEAVRSGQSNSLYVGRVIGIPLGSTLTGMYAWDNQRLFYSTNTEVSPSAVGLSAKDGADITYTDNVLSIQFSTIFANDNAWTFVDNKLPILTTVGGNQSNALPLHMQ